MISDTRNITTEIAFQNVPEPLIERDQWVLWKSVTRDGKPTKIPFDVYRRAASSTDPSTWADFESVVTTFDESLDSGIGFVFTVEENLLGVDLDGCRNPATGTIEPWAQKIVSDFQTYTEVSPSGTGVKLWAISQTQLDKGKKTELPVPNLYDKTPGIEIYSQGRYFAVTGNKLSGHDVITDCTAQVDRLLVVHWPNDPAPSEPQHEWRSDDAVVERARKYMAKVPGAVSGQSGHNAAFAAACSLVLGFDLRPNQAMQVLREWNQSCVPPWSEDELQHKIDDAAKQLGERGYLRNAKPENWDRLSSRVQSESVYTSGLKPCRNGQSVDKTKLTQLKPQDYTPFPVENLPDVLRVFCNEVSAAVGCDLSFVALPALAVCAAAIGRSRQLRIKSGWFVPSVLWTLIVGESGTQKSPPVRLATRPFRDLQSEQAESYLRDLAAYHDEAATYKTALKRWNQTQEGDKPVEPVQPSRPRCLVQDSTIEALAPILKDNERGVLMARDELAGWLASFDRYASGKGKSSGDVPKWLEIYNCESIVIDRKTGDAPFLFVKSPSVNICGGIQPDILASCMTDEHKSSGLESRILMAYPPRRPKQWHDEELSDKTMTAYGDCITELFRLGMSVDISGNPIPATLKLSPAALNLFKNFVNANGAEQQALHGPLASQWSKLEEIPARLAIVLHCVHQVTTGVDDAFIIGERTMSESIQLTEWFKTECLRIKSALSEPEEIREARHLVEWIRDHGGRITARALRQNRRDIGTTEQAELKLIHLVSIGAGDWQGIHASREFVLRSE